MDNTQVIDLIRYNAYQIRVEAAPSTATLNNYDYLLNLAKRMLAIEEAIIVCEDFENESVASLVATSIHKAVMRLIPSFGLGDFDWDGIGEDLAIIMGNAEYILESCVEDGLAQSICDKYNLFQTMCEIQEKLDEEWLTTIAND